MAWIVKKHEASLTDYGTYPGARSIKDYVDNGIIILDKPSGPTCNQIDTWVKEILNINKCSHAGTLDPRATGVLVIAIENATKLMPIMLSSKKEYVGIMYLHKDVDQEKIRKVFDDFVGKVKQLPPLKSAVARRERIREIYYLEIIEIEGRNILFKVGCQAGFYVRRLAVDIGERLGVKSHLKELRRTKSGNFEEKDMITLQGLMDGVAQNKVKEVVKPMEIAMEKTRKVIVFDTTVDNVCNGSPLYTGGIARLEDNIKKGEWVAVFSNKGELIAIGKSCMKSKDMAKKKGIAVKIDRVLMKKGTYPKQ
ncbi:MAG: RNA-guided pseudouridylation complex pseudouridine synthase subunit Cbf5 [Candidatus Aenigmarchaeota archaeon]|nr:RNA-guided pseudouridylation complex pseudouridine synthase subunit Cbf5 [Candidatus Aenigmarchaeota archaeon]